MGMVVRTNVMAVNANRQLGQNNTLVGKSLEKLSSGFRINRAGDDASGLAISEKMKAQIKGLEQASANSQDGISLVQTAEGNLTETHNMLNRMVELATKSANGTIQNDVDRDNIQNEFDSLVDEIDRISSSANFNGIKLLDGSLAGGGTGALRASTITIGGVAATKTEVSATKFKATTGAVAGTVTNAQVVFKDKNGASKTLDLSTTTAGDGADLVAKMNADVDFSSMYTAKYGADKKITFESKKTGKTATDVVKYAEGTSSTLTATAITGAVGGINASTSYDLSGAFAEGDKISVGGRTFKFAAAADGTNGETFKDLATLKIAAAEHDITVNDGVDTAVTFERAGDGGGLSLQIGDTAEAFNMVTVSVDDMSSAGLGIDGLKGNGVALQESAKASIDMIKTAINTVSTTRGTLGALQNRLEYTINNLDVTAENMTAANSRIRDTDMAKEMMSYTKMNVLTQSAQAMLAQANQQPQSILQLLQ